jgi:hypothetical protein
MSLQPSLQPSNWSSVDMASLMLTTNTQPSTPQTAQPTTANFDNLIPTALGNADRALKIQSKALDMLDATLEGGLGVNPSIPMQAAQIAKLMGNTFMADIKGAHKLNTWA